MAHSDVFTPLPAPAQLVRQINELRWWDAVRFLQDNPTVTSCIASFPHHEWSWILFRTSENGVFLQNTYFNHTLVTSTPMNTNLISPPLTSLF